MSRRKTPSFEGLRPSSVNARKAAQGASKKKGTKPELVLRRALWSAGLRYRKNVDDLPGKPDIVFLSKRVAVFVDGDFWHGRNWKDRRERLATHNNADYWIRKIESNIRRDERHVRELEAAGWTVLRFWETDIKRRLPEVVIEIRHLVDH